MSANVDGFNYAKALGYSSEPAAILFAALYVPLLAWFIRQSFARPTYVHFLLVIFCQIRVAAFAIRAVLTASETAGQTLGIVIADQVLSGVGYFGLLYSAYTLVLDIERICGTKSSYHPVSKVFKNRHIFRMVLSTAVALGIVSATLNKGRGGSTASLLHKISIVVFLILTILQASQTAMLANMEYSGKAIITRETQYRYGHSSFGRKHGINILLVIAGLLLVREIFLVATMSNSGRQNNEHFWYPLVAVPEIIAVILYATPDLVPKKDETPIVNKLEVADA